MISPKKKLLMVGQGGGGIDSLFATTLTSATTGTAVPLRFAPDLDWHKRRSAASDHALLDSRRGAFTLASNTTSAQAATSVGYAPDGARRSTVALGAGTGEVIWSLRRSRRFFDVVRYIGDGTIGRKIPHSLGAEPGMIAVKRLDADGAWSVLHRSLNEAARYLDLSSGAAAGNNNGNRIEAMSASDFTLNNNNMNISGANYVAYLFAHDPSPSGIIQCGSYTGNGSSSGPSVNLGWEPQWLLAKNTTNSGDWHILDSRRSTANPRQAALRPNSTAAETSNGSQAIDFLSNGFRPATSALDVNGSNNQYVYMAIRKGAT